MSFDNNFHVIKLYNYYIVDKYIPVLRLKILEYFFHYEFGNKINNS